jgi:hypothetical protein
MQQLREKLETIERMLRAGIGRKKIAEGTGVNLGTLSTISIMLAAGYKTRKRRVAAKEQE